MIREATTQLLELYEFEDEREVENYLFLHPSLIGVLKEVRHKIDDYFGPDVPAVIEVFIDPEGSGKQLFALIASDLPLEKAADRLELLWEEWWLDRLATVRPGMCVDIG